MLLAVIVVIIVITITVLRHKKRRISGVEKKKIHKLEHDRKNLDKMLSKGLITEKEYEIAKKDIEKQLKEMKEN